jgi:hypothetical protein
MKKPKILKPVARVGCVILKDVTFKYQGIQELGETRHKQPPVGEVVSCTRPGEDIKQLLPWDDRIVVGALVLLPRTQKYEFPVGDGTKLLSVHHSDLRVFYEVDGGKGKVAHVTQCAHKAPHRV